MEFRKFMKNNVKRISGLILLSALMVPNISAVGPATKKLINGSTALAATAGILSQALVGAFVASEIYDAGLPNGSIKEKIGSFLCDEAARWENIDCLTGLTYSSYQLAKTAIDSVKAINGNEKLEESVKNCGRKLAIVKGLRDLYFSGCAAMPFFKYYKGFKLTIENYQNHGDFGRLKSVLLVTASLASLFGAYKGASGAYSNFKLALKPEAKA